MFRQILIPAAFAAAALFPVASRAAFDPSRLPATAGRVAHYSLTPGGAVDGLILEDGTEVFLPPHLGPLLFEVVRPGDAVTVRGLRARVVPVVQAVSVGNDATGRSVTDDGDPAAPPAPPGPAGPRRPVSVSGVVEQWLHGPRGDLNGLLLRDGTVVRFPPEQAAAAARWQPGMPVTVEGNGVSGPQGRVVAAVRIGSEPDPRPPAPREPRP